MVLGMIALFSSIALIYARGGGENISLKRSAVSLSVAIQSARQNAIGAIPDQATGVRPCGWGVHIQQPTSYYIFVDKPSGNDCSLARNFIMDGSCVGAQDSGNECRKSYELDAGIKFDPSTVISDIVFDPPLPDMTIKTVSGKTNQGAIILVGQSGIKKTINVNIFGQINIQN